MTGRDRMLVALEGGEPDQVPMWELIVNEPTLSALAGPGATGAEFVEVMGLDGITIFENQRLEQAADGSLLDEWGIRWGCSQVGVPYPSGHVLSSPEDLDTYQPPDPAAPWRLTDLERAVERFGGEKAVVFLTHDAFEFAANLRGMENLLADFLLDPPFVRRLFRTVLDYKQGVLERALEAGADAVVAGDDYAWRQGPIMSPRHFQEYIHPCLREMVEITHRAGVPFIKHTDGHIWPIMDSLLATGMDALDPIEPMAGMDIGEVKERLGDRIALVGNVDCTMVLTQGSLEEVAEAVRETIAKASPGGGHVLASSNSIHPAVRPENYRAMVEAGRRWGKYPLDGAMVAEYRGRSYLRKYLAPEKI